MRRTVLLFVGLVLVAGCATDPVVDSPLATPAPTSSAAASTTPGNTTAPTPTPTPTPPPGVDQVVRLQVAGGKVVGGVQRTKVAKGANVSLVVTSDVADEVHLHTYDKRAAVAAGGTVTLTFRATISGVFELELEKAGLLLTNVQVQ